MKLKARALFAAALVFSVMLAVFSCDTGSEKSLVAGLVNPNKGTWNVLEGFVEWMAGQGFQGYVEGKNITYIRAKNKDTLEADIKAIVEKKADLIFTVTTPATKIARKATGNTGILKPGANFIRKLLTPSKLVKKLREVLDNDTEMDAG